MKPLINKISFCIVLAVIVTGCAGGGMLQNNDAHIYNQDYDHMVDVVKQAILDGPRSIYNIDENKKDSLTHIQFKQSMNNTNNQHVQQARGKATIRKMGKNKTSVEIEDPDYEYTVPDRQRVKYERVLMNGIDKILGK